MTIEELYIRDEISILTRNICIANQIKIVDDLKRHYIKSGTFRNLPYCDEKCNEVLIDVYNKYKDLFNENETAHFASINKNEVNLEDVVTDLDEVDKVIQTANTYFREIDKKLEEYWREKAEKGDLSMMTVFEVTNVVDLEEAKQTIEAYRIKEVSEEITEPIGITNLELEQRRKKQRSEKAHIEAKERRLKSKSTFGRHPSKRLNDLYLIKNYQGANPVDAKVIFVGRDSNWAADIDERKMFGSVVEYLTDGIAFWVKHNIHHLFLLKSYKGDGSKYHRNFSKLNLDSNKASKVSFVKLISFPTTGMSSSNIKSFRKYLLSEENNEHLIELDKILSNNDKIIFTAWGLINDFKFINRRTGLFDKLAKLDKSKMDMSDLNQYENIFIHRHFSDAISSSTIAKMENIVRAYF